jgi:hypothetical protein
MDALPLLMDKAHSDETALACNKTGPVPEFEPNPWFGRNLQVCVDKSKPAGILRKIRK